MSCPSSRRMTRLLLLGLAIVFLSSEHLFLPVKAIVEASSASNDTALPAVYRNTHSSKGSSSSSTSKSNVASPASPQLSTSQSRSSQTIDTDMHPDQVAIMLEIANEWPELQNFSAGAWNEANLVASCRTPQSAYGIVACNATGWITSLRLLDLVVPSGPLPDAVGDLEALTNLELFSFGLNGTLPSRWSSLAQLSKLTIYASVSGPLPASWSSLTSLSELNLRWAPTGETSTVETPWIVNSLPKSQNLALTLSGYNFGMASPLPAELFETTSIISLTLSDVLFDGSVPQDLTYNSLLTSLTISATSSVAQLPPSATPMPSSEWANMTILGSLTLKNLPWSGTFPAVLPPVSTLTLTNLPYLSGSLPHHLFDGFYLMNIYLDTLPNVTGGVSISTSSILTTLSLNNMGLNGTLNATLFSASALADLVITNMEHLPQHSLPESLTCPYLQTVKFTNVNLAGSIPNAFATECSRLSTIDLSDNHLIGQIPSSWESENIQSFIVENNQLSGNLPSGLGASLGSDASLSIANNTISGTIASSFYTKSFTRFDISDNHLDVCATASSPLFGLQATRCAVYPQSSESTSACDCVGVGWPTNCLGPAECTPPSPPSVPSDTAPTPFVEPFDLPPDVFIPPEDMSSTPPTQSPPSSTPASFPNFGPTVPTGDATRLTTSVGALFLYFIFVFVF